MAAVRANKPTVSLWRDETILLNKANTTQKKQYEDIDLNLEAAVTVI